MLTRRLLVLAIHTILAQYRVTDLAGVGFPQFILTTLGACPGAGYQGIVYRFDLRHLIGEILNRVCVRALVRISVLCLVIRV